MITIFFRRKAPFATRAGCAVGGQPVTEGRNRALKASTGGFGVIPDILPDAVYELSHFLLLRQIAKARRCLLALNVISIACLPLLIQKTVDAVGARTRDS